MMELREEQRAGKALLQGLRMRMYCAARNASSVAVLASACSSGSMAAQGPVGRAADTPPASTVGTVNPHRRVSSQFSRRLRRVAAALASAACFFGSMQSAAAYDTGLLYSAGWTTLGWQSSPQAACDAVAAVFDANNGNYAPAPNHQFIASHFLLNDSYCAVKYYLDTDPAHQLHDWGYAIYTMRVVDIDRTKSPPKSCSSGNPIYPAQATKTETIDTGVTLGRQRLTLTYDSASIFPLPIGAAGSIDPKPAVLGPRWDSTFHRRLLQQGSTGVLVSRGDGRTSSFRRDENGAYSTDADLDDRLVSISGGFRYFDSTSAAQELYDSTGKLVSISWTSGDSISLSYSSSATPATVAPAPDYLIQAQDSRGHSVNFTYELPADAPPSDRRATETDRRPCWSGDRNDLRRHRQCRFRRLARWHVEIAAL